MTDRSLPRRALIAWATSAALWLLGVVPWVVRRASPVLVALWFSASLLGCGAAPAVAHGPWAQTLPSGVRVFRVCRRHPRVNPKAAYWYQEGDGDGTPRTAFVPIEEILESSSVKAVFIHDPHAPPESRRLLGLAFQDLPCDEPPPPPIAPPPKTNVAKKAPEREKVERAEPPKKKAQSTVRTVTRRRLPDRRFIGQTARTPLPCHPPQFAPLPSERATQEYEDWGIEPADVSALTAERGRECLEKLCHARHPSFIPKGKKPAGGREGQSCSTGSGSGSGTSSKQPAPKTAAKPAAKTTVKTTTKPAAKTTVKTTTKPAAKPNGAAAGQAGRKARLPPKGTPERRAIETARKKGIETKQAQELANIRAGGRGSGVWTDEELKGIRETGEFPRDAIWHHDPTVANRPDLAADPSVVRPVRGGTQGHLKAHGGDFRKP